MLTLQQLSDVRHWHIVHLSKLSPRLARDVAIAPARDVPGTLIYGPIDINAATSAAIPAPAANTYYMHVLAKDSSGNTTRSFNHVDIGDQRYFGVSDFTLTPCP